MGFSAYSILLFCCNHHLLRIFGHPQWLTVRWKSHTYVNKVVSKDLENRGCQIRTGCEVNSVSMYEKDCTVACIDGFKEAYDGCVMVAHAPDTLRMLGEEETYDETRILGAFQYVYWSVTNRKLFLADMAHISGLVAAGSHHHLIMLCCH